MAYIEIRYLKQIGGDIYDMNQDEMITLRSHLLTWKIEQCIDLALEQCLVVGLLDVAKSPRIRFIPGRSRSNEIKSITRQT